jgi:hypothetical protein
MKEGFPIRCKYFVPVFINGRKEFLTIFQGIHKDRIAASRGI